MPQPADVIIVGGGVTGLCSAIHLKQLGVREVTILERHHVGSGQSHRAAGIVRALVRHPLVAKALVESIDFIKTFQDRFDDSMAYHPSGYLLLTESQQAEIVNDSIAAMTSVGCSANLVDMQQACQLQPGLRTDDQTLYVHEPGAVHVDPMPALQAMARVAKKLGVKIVEGCNVGTILLRKAGIAGVDTSQGSFHSSAVLIATAVWGRTLLLQLGIDVPRRPRQSHSPPTRSHSIVTARDRCACLSSSGRDGFLPCACFKKLPVIADHF